MNKHATQGNPITRNNYKSNQVSSNEFQTKQQAHQVLLIGGSEQDENSPNDLLRNKEDTALTQLWMGHEGHGLLSSIRLHRMNVLKAL